MSVEFVCCTCSIKVKLGLIWGGGGDLSWGWGGGKTLRMTPEGCSCVHTQDHSLLPLLHFHFLFHSIISLSHMQKLYSGGDYSVRTDDGQAISHWVESFSKNPQKATVNFSLSSSYPPPPPPCLHEVLVFPPIILRLLPSSSKASGRLTL